MGEVSLYPKKYESPNQLGKIFIVNQLWECTQQSVNMND